MGSYFEPINDRSRIMIKPLPISFIPSCGYSTPQISAHPHLCIKLSQPFNKAAYQLRGFFLRLNDYGVVFDLYKAYFKSMLSQEGPIFMLVFEFYKFIPACSDRRIAIDNDEPAPGG
jgi:hypothetical protein